MEAIMKRLNMIKCNEEAEDREGKPKRAEREIWKIWRLGKGSECLREGWMKWF